MLRLGLLAGLSYTIDVGTGPLLLGGAAVWLRIAAGVRRRWPCSRLAAAPWVLLHHGLNYMIGGTLGPANADPAYFDWPGSPFNAQTMTGGWGHAGVLSCVLYALDLLGGKQGFLGHNLMLGLAVGGCLHLRLCRRPSADRPEAVLAVVWCVGTWLLYSVTSTNHSGVCCSVRWFVPLLAAGILHFGDLVTGLLAGPAARLRDPVRLGGGAGGVMWWAGPWTAHRIPGYWAIQIAGLTSLLASVYVRWREPAGGESGPAGGTQGGVTTFPPFV